MVKFIATAPNADTPGFTIIFRLICLSVTLFLVLFGSNISLAQQNPSPETDTLQKTTAEPQASPVSDKPSESEQAIKDKTFSVTLFRPNYFLGITYNENPNEKTYEEAGLDKPYIYEAQFQLSFKMLVKKNLFNIKGDLFAAYTQHSWWQIYNASSPFRETNYEPELFLRFNTDFPVMPGLRNKQFLFGAVHQSNGQSGVLSRSWNRIYIEFIARKGNFMLALKPWYRIPENEKSDDNPDIDRYLGSAKLYGAYQYGNNVFSFTLHNNLRSDENRGAIELGWSYALLSNLRLFLQYYNGYGESLIDYNNFTNRIGLGLMINDWL